MKREYPESQPKYAIAQTIPNAGTGRMRSPYPKADNNWYYTNEETELLLVPYETFRSLELPYLDGSAIAFTHNWNSFNPESDWYQVQVGARCNQFDSGWDVGDIAIFSGYGSGLSLEITTTEIIVRILPSGIILGRKDGNLKSFTLDPLSWVLFILGVRKIG